MNKRDLQAEAKRLCLAAGQNPDELVVPEGKGACPAWVTFIDAAKISLSPTQILGAGVEGQTINYKDAPLTVFGRHEQNTLDQMVECMKVGNTVGGVICADGHLGYAQPVGGVIAYEDQVSVSGVGFDIGCGNMAMRLDLPYGAIKEYVPGILEDIASNISFGVGRVNSHKVEHELFDDADAWLESGMMDFRKKAEEQLGTVGSGNHYVDLLVETTYLDDPEFPGDIGDCPVWIGVHFGSRGLGHTTATRYIKVAGGKDGINVPPAVLSLSSDAGRAYMAGMELAGRYAYAGREWVVERVRKIIGGNPMEVIHNHHNYAWRETHGGKDLIVVRKGATPAFPGQKGFVGGSMGDDAVIVEGVDNALSKGAFYSTIHGAGRNFGRKEAHRRFTRHEMDTWLRERGVHLIGGDLDESPMAYRRLPTVLRAQKNTIKVVNTLRPFGVVMAGNGEFDPYKD